MFALRRVVCSSRFFSLLAKNMEKHGIIPEVIDVAPEIEAEVIYPGGVKVDQGNVLKPTQVQYKPCVLWKNVDDNAFYTVCMIDPDAPSRQTPKFKEWQHWLVGNILGDSIDTGETLSAYVGSGPPPKTGLHRYVFLIYKQPGEIAFKEKRLPNNSGKGRGGFSIRRFAQKYKLGEPIAGNFFHAEWDDYVPLLYKQLGVEFSD